MKFPKYYIGPMSKNIVDCAIEHAQRYPIGLIPSRRQVDFCGGYVNEWTTQNFSKYVKDRNSPVLLCRDHGGENQGLEMDDGIESFLNDCDNFHLIHVDPFKVSKTILDAAEKTCTIIIKIWNKNPNIMYEVGTEEAIFKYEPEELKWLLEYLKMGLTQEQFNCIKYAVVQSGTGLDLPTRTNIGNFNSRRLKSFVKVAKKYRLMSKEHNGDYLIDSFGVEVRYQIGLDAINIAPEFGQIESEYYLEECKKKTELFDELYALCYDSGRWEKWISNIERVSKDQLIRTCCHYILSDKEFINKIKSNFPSADEIIRKRIKSKLGLLNEQAKNYCV